MITNYEKEEMARYIREYAVKNEEYVSNSPSLEGLLDEWESAKSQYLAKMFKGQAILTREVEYDATEQELYNLYKEYYGYHSYHTNFFVKLSDIFWEHPDFIQYRIDIHNKSGNSTANLLTDVHTLMRNRWIDEETVLPLPNGRSFKIGPGTKITKILGRLAKEWDIPGWEDVREAHAKALTAKRTKGTLCLSIHPMDYMTMSDNEEDWESCMNWREEGCYRAGTIEMMTSPMVVVAYMKSNTNSLWNYNWNSKVWRELFIVHPDIITNIKAYPHPNEYLSVYIGNWLRELAEEAGIGVYDPNYHNLSDEAWFRENKIGFSFRTNTMYNDCGRTNQYTYVSKNITPGHKIINYSGKRVCVICGGIVDAERDASSLVCDDCDASERCYCTHCGRAIANDDDMYYLEGDVYCYSCYDELAIIPTDDDEPRFYTDTTPCYLKLPDGNYAPYELHVFDPSTFAEVLGLKELPKDGLNKYYIPYKNAHFYLKREAGITPETQAIYDAWEDLDEEERWAKLNTYAANEEKRWHEVTTYTAGKWT